MTKGKRASAKTDAMWLKNAIGKKKGGRSFQAIELYQQRNKEMIEQRVRLEVDQKGAKTNKERMTIRRQVVAEMWQNEDEDLVADIKEEIERQKKNEGKNNLSRKGASEERTPEEYNE